MVCRTVDCLHHYFSAVTEVVALQDGFSMGFCASVHEKETDSDVLTSAAAEVAPPQASHATPDKNQQAGHGEDDAAEQPDAQPTDHEEEEGHKMPSGALASTSMDPDGVSEWNGENPSLGEAEEEIPTFFHPYSDPDDHGDLGEGNTVWVPLNIHGRPPAPPPSAKHKKVLVGHTLFRFPSTVQLIV